MQCSSTKIKLLWTTWKQMHLRNQKGQQHFAKRNNAVVQINLSTNLYVCLHFDLFNKGLFYLTWYCLYARAKEYRSLSELKRRLCLPACFVRYALVVCIAQTAPRYMVSWKCKCQWHGGDAFFRAPDSLTSQCYHLLPLIHHIKYAQNTTWGCFSEIQSMYSKF